MIEPPRYQDAKEKQFMLFSVVIQRVIITCMLSIGSLRVLRGAML